PARPLGHAHRALPDPGTTAGLPGTFRRAAIADTDGALARQRQPLARFDQGKTAGSAARAVDLPARGLPAIAGEPGPASATPGPAGGGQRAASGTHRAVRRTQSTGDRKSTRLNSSHVKI